MTYTVGHWLHSARGHIGTSATVIKDIWSVSVKLAPASASTVISQSSLDAFLAAAEPLWKTFHQNGNLAAGTNVWLTNLTIAQVGLEGKYVAGANQTTTIRTIATPVAGAGTQSIPFATSCVISLRTAKFRGVGSHGRFYYPCLGGTVDATTGLWGAATPGIIATAAKTLLDGLNTAAGANLGSGVRLSVLSHGGKSGPATTQEVIKLMVDNKPDHMESRESELPSVYSSANLA